jgi:hypothetical protein
MAHASLAPLTNSVTNAKGAMASAVVLIGGIAAKVQAGIDAALADGVSADALIELTELQASLDADTQALAAAVAANP